MRWTRSGISIGGYRGPYLVNDRREETKRCPSSHFSPSRGRTGSHCTSNCLIRLGRAVRSELWKLLAANLRIVQISHGMAMEALLAKSLQIKFIRHGRALPPLEPNFRLMLV